MTEIHERNSAETTFSFVESEFINYQSRVRTETKQKQRNVSKGNSIPTVYAAVHDPHKLIIACLIFYKINSRDRYYLKKLLVDI